MNAYRYALVAGTALALAGPALPQAGFAQTNSFSGGSSEPRSARASNINAGDSPSDVAPSLPTPMAGEDATTRAYLQDARRALASGRTGRAQEAMERAETRQLDRSVDPSRIGVPADSRLVATISQARQALGAGDRAGAMRMLDEAMADTTGGASRPPYPAVPALRSERVPPPPMAGEAWEAGHWNWNGTAYDWSGGRYVARASSGVFVPGQWTNSNNAWVWAPAHWEG